MCRNSKTCQSRPTRGIKGRTHDYRVELDQGPGKHVRRVRAKSPRPIVPRLMIPRLMTLRLMIPLPMSPRLMFRVWRNESRSLRDIAVAKNDGRSIAPACQVQDLSRGGT